MHGVHGDVLGAQMLLRASLSVFSALLFVSRCRWWEAYRNITMRYPTSRLLAGKRVSAAYLMCTASVSSLMP